MTYAIISDVHANEIALAAVLADARRHGVGRVICLGDVVGYGPEPARTIATIRRTAAVTLAGNHDDAVAGRLDASDFIDLAADAVARHREAISTGDLDWLKSLPYVFKGRSFACAHGDFTSPRAFKYVSDVSEAAANFAARAEQLLFVGHSHVPGIFLTGASGKVYSAEQWENHDVQRQVAAPNLANRNQKLDHYNVSVGNNTLKRYQQKGEYVGYTNSFFRDFLETVTLVGSHKDWFKQI